mgnify:CR=1 FL=1
MLLPKVQVKIHSASCKTGRTAHTHLHHQIRAKHPLESVAYYRYFMNFVRAFELYERRWGIEVIFKECRGYLGLGKCQSRSYNAQIAETTLCFMMYQMLSLAKRFSEYETLGDYSARSVTGCKCSPCGAELWKKSGICWKFCRVKQEWIC